jgi:hypothetical protein
MIGHPIHGWDESAAEEAAMADEVGGAAEYNEEPLTRDGIGVATESLGAARGPCPATSVGHATATVSTISVLFMMNEIASNGYARIRGGE